MNPSISTRGIAHRKESRSPLIIPIIRDPVPEKMPFRRTICKGSFDDSFLVQLFSMPQHTVARRMKSDPVLNWKLDVSSKDRSIQDAVTKMMPSHSLVDIFSLNIARAITAVATISKLLRRDAFAAEVILSPKRRKIGAAISSVIMAIV